LTSKTISSSPWTSEPRSPNDESAKNPAIPAINSTAPKISEYHCAGVRSSRSRSTVRSLAAILVLLSAMRLRVVIRSGCAETP